MNTTALYAIISVILVSLVSVVSIIPMIFKRKASNKVLLVLLSLSAGSLIGGVFIHFFPEIIEEQGYNLSVALKIILGFMVFFVIEKLIHFHHNHVKIDKKDEEAHGHAYHLAPLNLIGDAIHNLMDGMVIAGAYMSNTALGVAATVSVIFHEIPQEIADFGVLLYSGMSKLKAIFANFLSALASIIGAVFTLYLGSRIDSFHDFVIPFAAGNFLYIATTNLMPELHRHCKPLDTIIHILSISFGIFLMIGVSILFPTH